MAPIDKSSLNDFEGITLTPDKHFEGYEFEQRPYSNGFKNQKHVIDDISKHFTRDTNDKTLANKPVMVENNGVQEPVFSGSTTNINPTNDSDKASIINYGLENYEIERIKSAGGETLSTPAISPIHPFTRMDPSTAQISNLTTYNRTKLPISDLEFRKGFRHIFITRPECYIMAYSNVDGSLDPVLSEQAKYDSDFSSCWSRMPHILKILSPLYVTGAFSQNDVNSNWNYLLSNRVISINSNTQTSININEKVTKSIDGYTITPVSTLQSDIGSTVELTFRDTKNLEVYEMLRMWILYMHKRKKGIFAPPYNGYQYRNGFISGISSESGKAVYTGDGSSSRYALMYHPYDRALEYCSSLFEIVTNESMTKIIQWTKYYGIYPTDVSINNFSSENGGPITNDLTVSGTFKYHYKLSGDNKSLVEFNYNAGITSDTGKLIKSVEASHPFLLVDEDDKSMMEHYIGGAGMFTGSPYIVLGKSQNDPLNADNDILVPYLRFMPLNEGKLNSDINLGLTNVTNEPEGIIAITDDV